MIKLGFLCIIAFCCMASASQIISKRAKSCYSDSDCGRNSCCDLTDLIVTKKREDIAGASADFSILPISGSCRRFGQENEPCGCGCAEGLTCQSQFPIATRIVAADFDGSFGSSICMKPDPGLDLVPCSSNDDCCSNECCAYLNSDIPIATKKRAEAAKLLPPSLRYCIPYKQRGELCSGECGCAPGLSCHILKRRDEVAGALIAPFPGTCEDIFSITFKR